jgi:hypothetical protein
MKSEIMRIPGKGLCIVISELDVQSLIGDNITTLGGGIFSDVYSIAELIRTEKKIGAIKEIRVQTGWGLKESKEFIDKYIPMGYPINFNFNAAADRFVIDYSPKDFLNDEDMKL